MSSRTPKLVIFAWLAAQLAPDRRYTEAEINALLGAAHPDFATLRRGLYDEYFVDRDGGYYWRTPGAERLRVAQPSGLRLPSPPG